MTPTTMAHRVASRFVEGDTAHDDLASAPILTAQQLADELAPTFGLLAVVKIHPPAGDDPTVARWEATTTGGMVIRGIVTISTSWVDGSMIVRPEVEVAGAVGASTGATTAAATPRQLLDDRLKEVVVQLRRLVTEIRVRPGVPAHELARELQGVIELAEIDG